MIDLRKIGDDCVWPEILKPMGYGDHRVEDFEIWYERNETHLGHLPKTLVEQWVYRHWCDSIASFIPIENLEWREETWPAHDFTTKIGTVRGNDPLEPERDFEVFSGQRGGKKLKTAIELDAGCWVYPLVVLETPGGFIDCVGDHIANDFFLVEGHKRRRYLNALLVRGETVSCQQVFVLTSPWLR